MTRKILIGIGSVALLIIVFNRVTPLFKADEKTEVKQVAEPVEISSPVEKEATLLMPVGLPRDTGTISARPIEYGRWLLFVDDTKALLEKTFNEFGMLTCWPEFDLFIKSNLRKTMPSIDLNEALIQIVPDCSGEYEMIVVDKEHAATLMKIFTKLYTSEAHLYAEVSEFKRQLKLCRKPNGQTEGVVCEEFIKNPLPEPKPLVLGINDEGEDVLLRGFTECYYDYFKNHNGESSKEDLSQSAKEACYSSW